MHKEAWIWKLLAILFLQMVITSGFIIKNSNSNNFDSLEIERDKEEKILLDKLEADVDKDFVEENRVEVETTAEPVDKYFKVQIKKGRNLDLGMGLDLPPRSFPRLG